MGELLLLLIIVLVLVIIRLVYCVIHHDDGCENGEPSYPLTYDIVSSIVKKLENRKKNLLRKKIDEMLEGRMQVSKAKLSTCIAKLEKQLQSDIKIFEVFGGKEDESEESGKVRNFFASYICGTSKEEIEKDKKRLDKLLELKGVS